MTIPSLQTGDFELDRACRIALGDVVGNVLPYRSGLLDEPAPCLVAGLSYPDPWTRDAAINTRNVGLLWPEVMRNTLLSCLTRGDTAAGMGTGCHDVAGSAVPAGVLSVGGQYWDRVIWAVGAWAYYAQTGDRAFLALALEAVANTLTYLEANEFDDKTGLFRGGACFHDGIGAYADRYARQEGTAIYTWPAANPKERHPVGAGVPLQALSTNCLYAEACRLAECMAEELGEAPDPRWATLRQQVVAGLHRHLWLAAEQRFRFYVDPWDDCGGRHEALGNALALLFDLYPAGQADAVIAAQPRCPAGPPSVWPDWPRYREAGVDNFGAPPGRDDIAAESQVLCGDPRSVAVYAGHGAAVWPFVQGFWAEALLRHGRTEAFAEELRTLAHTICRAVQCPENVHPDSGLPYGGVQEDGAGKIVRWVSCYRQTWTATAYLRLLLHGVFGLDARPDGLRVRPWLPTGVDHATLRGLPWRQATIDLTVERGATTGLFLGDRPIDRLAPDFTGYGEVRAVVAEATP